MRFRSCYIPTLKETPADAEVISHKLLVRAGLIRKITSGVYTYMPLALRALRKIETVVREEMAQAGFEELLLPMVQPGDSRNAVDAAIFSRLNGKVFPPPEKIHQSLFRMIGHCIDGKVTAFQILG